MRHFTRGIAAVLLVSFASLAFSQDYTDETTFKNLLGPNYYNELFSGWNYGPPPPPNTATTWTGVGTFYNAEAFLASGLWAVQDQFMPSEGGLSTNLGTGGNQTITLVIDFANSSNPVYAVGGLFQDVDQSGLNEDGNVTITFNNGHSMTLDSLTTTSFYGYISSTPLTSMSIDVGGGTQSTNYQYLGDLYVGAPLSTPEPASIAALAIGGIALIRRRRR